ncbi:creatininase family protein [Sesbania bispinosa]|nr:creatininase family protein [Sesbania bispinosa]
MMTLSGEGVPQATYLYERLQRQRVSELVARDFEGFQCGTHAKLDRDDTSELLEEEIEFDQSGAGVDEALRNLAMVHIPETDAEDVDFASDFVSFESQMFMKQERTSRKGSRQDVWDRSMMMSEEEHLKLWDTEMAEEVRLVDLV